MPIGRGGAAVAGGFVGTLIGYMVGSQKVVAAAEPDVNITNILGKMTSRTVQYYTTAFTVQGVSFVGGTKTYSQGFVMQLANNLHLVKTGDGRDSSRMPLFELCLVHDGVKIPLVAPEVQDGSFQIRQFLDDTALEWVVHSGCGQKGAVQNRIFIIRLDFETGAISWRQPDDLVVATALGQLTNPAGTGYNHVTGVARTPAGEYIFYVTAMSYWNTTPLSSRGISTVTFSETGSFTVHKDFYSQASNPAYSQLGMKWPYEPVGFQIDVTDHQNIVLAFANGESQYADPLSWELPQYCVFYTADGGATWAFSKEYFQLHSAAKSASQATGRYVHLGLISYYSDDLSLTTAVIGTPRNGVHRFLALNGTVGDE